MRKFKKITSIALICSFLFTGAAYPEPALRVPMRFDRGQKETSSDRFMGNARGGKEKSEKTGIKTRLFPTGNGYSRLKSPRYILLEAMEKLKENPSYRLTDTEIKDIFEAFKKSLLEKTTPVDRKNYLKDILQYLRAESIRFSSINPDINKLRERFKYYVERNNNFTREGITDTKKGVDPEKTIALFKRLGLPYYRSAISHFDPRLSSQEGRQAFANGAQFLRLGTTERLAKFYEVVKYYEKDLKAKEMLDIECAYGLFSFILRNLDVKTSGLELDGELTRFGKEAGLEIVEGDIASEKVPITRQFDITTSVYVLDHIQLKDPVVFSKVFNNIFNLTKDGGWSIHYLSEDNYSVFEKELARLNPYLIDRIFVDGSVILVLKKPEADISPISQLHPTLPEVVALLERDQGAIPTPPLEDRVKRSPEIRTESITIELVVYETSFYKKEITSNASRIAEAAGCKNGVILNLGSGNNPVVQRNFVNVDRNSIYKRMGGRFFCGDFKKGGFTKELQEKGLKPGEKVKGVFMHNSKGFISGRYDEDPLRMPEKPIEEAVFTSYFNKIWRDIVPDGGSFFFVDYTPLETTGSLDFMNAEIRSREESEKLVLKVEGFIKDLVGGQIEKIIQIKDEVSGKIVGIAVRKIGDTDWWEDDKEMEGQKIALTFTDLIKANFSRPRLLDLGSGEKALFCYSAARALKENGVEAKVYGISPAIKDAVIGDAVKCDINLRNMKMEELLVPTEKDKYDVVVLLAPDFILFDTENFLNILDHVLTKNGFVIMVPDAYADRGGPLAKTMLKMSLGNKWYVHDKVELDMQGLKDETPLGRPLIFSRASTRLKIPTIGLMHNIPSRGSRSDL